MRRKGPRGFLLWAAVLLPACAGDSTPDADLVLLHGNVLTVDPTRPIAEAVAVSGDTIVAVGSDREIRRYVGRETEVIDLGGWTVLPGFIEGHGHFMSLGRSKMNLDLTTARSWNEIVTMVGQAAADAPVGVWIQGHGWHQEKWDVAADPAIEGLPTHASLSAVSPNNPVVLTHASGHASFANARALDMAGIRRGTPNPPGGTIVRDRAGQPTGALRERAQLPVREALARWESTRSPAENAARQRRMVELAGRELLAKGVTSFHDAGSSFATIEFLQELAEAGELPVRLYVMVRYQTNDEMAARLPEFRRIGVGGGFLTVRSIKRQIDGALGPHGAWLLRPYEDLRSTGLILERPDDIARTAELAIQHGFQLNTHAIGDRANREVLDIYERVFAAHPGATDLRWRIEHAQHLHPNDIARFGQLGVIASVQGIHATSDGPWVIKRLGEQRAFEGAYVWRKLIDVGALVTNGTDAPVEDVDPIASFYASVTRRLADGSVFFPEQSMTRDEALRSYTINNAYAAFEEAIKGSLEPGKLADIVVLSRDIMTVPEDRIPGTEVVITIVGGKVVYRLGES